MKDLLSPLCRAIEAPLVAWSRRGRVVEEPPSAERPLGHVRQTLEPWSPSAKLLDRHCYLLGSTGCGKTSLIGHLIERDIQSGRSVVVLDLRGDLVQRALSLCQDLGLDPSRIHLLDLREKERILPFNPLVGAGEPYIRALHLLDVVRAESDSWGVQLEETMRVALLTLASSGESLTQIEKLLADASFRRRCNRMVGDEGVLAFWKHFDQLGPEKQASWMQPVLNKITPLLAVPALRLLLGCREGLDLGRFMSTPGKVLLVSLAVDELHRSSRMVGSLLVSAIAREAMARVNLSESRRTPVRLYVDEFENMASTSFETLVAEGRRFALTLVLSHQTLAQIPGKLRSVVRNNVGVQVLFQTGFEDANHLARELPDTIGVEHLRGLDVGEAVVLQRDGWCSTIRFVPPRPMRSSQSIEAFRDQVLPPPATGSPQTGPESEPEQPAQPTLDLEDWL